LTQNDNDVKNIAKSGETSIDLIASRNGRMTIGEILSRAFKIYLGKPIIIIPSLMPMVWLILGSIFFFAGFSGLLFFDISSIVASAFLFFLVLFIIIFYILFIIAEGVTIIMIRDAFQGGDADLSRAWQSSKNRLSALVIASIISGFLLTMGYLLFIIPGLILTLIFYFVVQAIIIDGASAMESFTTSYRFVRRDLSDSIIIIFVSMVIGVVLPMIPFIGIILSLLCIPYIYGIATLFYIDRKEVSERIKPFKVISPNID
jgi:hypothetical protein